jgi:predicted transglutaminase-like cysteine proteinase
MPRAPQCLNGRSGEASTFPKPSSQAALLSAYNPGLQANKKNKTGRGSWFRLISKLAHGGISMVSNLRIVAAGMLLAGLQAGSAWAKPAGALNLTPERMAQLQQVNSHVNSTIREVSDLEQYGREDVWTLPTSGKGDCEDFALLKRKMLVDRGWPSSALAITVGATSQGEAHAVLIVSTAQGQYVLDNLTSSILNPAQTGHVFYARQVGNHWISASGERTREPTVDFPVAQVGARGRRG